MPDKAMQIVQPDGTIEEVEALFLFEIHNKEYLAYTNRELDADGLVTVNCAILNRSTDPPHLDGVTPEDIPLIQKVLDKLANPTPTLMN